MRMQTRDRRETRPRRKRRRGSHEYTRCPTGVAEANPQTLSSLSPRRRWRGLACHSTIDNWTTTKADAEMKPLLCTEKYPEKFAGKYRQTYPELYARLRRQMRLHLNT
jgi:hypothetical protein